VQIKNLSVVKAKLIPFFTGAAPIVRIPCMGNINSVVFALLALIGVGLIVFGLLSPGAREARRRRRNYGRILSNSNRPMVKFSVRTKDKKKGK
jgi:ABC-type cobalt transport system substrate-binding protein